MLNGTENIKKSNCWIEKTELEKGLIAIVIISAFLISTLLVVVFLYTKQSEPPHIETCGTQTCIQEALEILNRIDTKINPCDNFYGFACNNMPKNIENYQYLQYFGPFTPMIEQAKINAEDMYREPIQNDDHQLVKAQKKLFHGCMNETAIVNDAFNTIKGILKAVGGWPVAEGLEWNETKFDWIQTTYKLRQLGYNYASFLELTVVPDPKNEEKYIFQVSIPEIKDVYSKWFDTDDKYGFMTDVAVVFGAEVHHALAQMTVAYQFLQELQWQREEVMEEDVIFQRVTVAEYQQKEATIDWLEFINRIAGPYARVSKNDYVLFPMERDLDEWFGLLLRTSNRTQANYMLWRVVEEALPYLTEELRKGRVKPRLMVGLPELSQTRSQFCIDKIRENFEPNPIEIMYVRKYLPKERRDAIIELLNNMKSELLNIVNKIDWMNANDKQSAVDRMKNVRFVVGAAGNYFGDEIFENFIVDLTKSNPNNFMALLAQIRRSHKDKLYSLVNKSRNETSLKWENLIVNIANYDLEKNELFVPASVIQSPTFNPQRPSYINYANMGLTLKYFFYGILGSVYEWSNETEKAFDTKRECLIHEINSDKAPIPNHMVNGLLAHNLALRVSYEAYKKSKNVKEELPLGAIEYNPKQLFWISSGYLYCHYTSGSFTKYLEANVAREYSSMVAKILNNNLNLGDDFQCPKGSVINSQHKCKIF